MRPPAARRVARLAFLISLIGLVGTTACSGDAGYESAPEEDEGAARTALESTPLGYVVSRDARGAARFILSGTDPGAAPHLPVRAETAARIHLSRHANLLGVPESTARKLVMTHARSYADGATVVQFIQRVKGVDVASSRASVVLDASKNLVSIAAQLNRDAEGVSTTQALEFPLSMESVLPMPGPRLTSSTPKRVLFAGTSALQPAYYVETLAREDGEGGERGYGYTVDARDGHVLRKTSLTASDSFRYRVWASPDGNHAPLESPWTRPALITMEGFNTNPKGQVDPWLAPNATMTFGNNVRAYSDRNDRHAAQDAGKALGNGYEPNIDLVADLTGPRVFDHTYDVTRNPDSSREQVKAAITQLFYVTNWLHDHWYDSGFDEVAGVAQLSNYGRGGVEGDPLLAEAQDGADFGSADNARMTTFSDGTSPRLEMHLWTGIPNRSFETVPALPLSDGFGASAFGPQVFDSDGDIVLADDGIGSRSDACEPANNVFGKIAVIDRGGCDFTVKAQNAQGGGAVAVILVNDLRGHAAVSPDVNDDTISIPFLSLSYEDGDALKRRLARGTMRARMRRGREPIRDSSIDAMVVAHEWGHYLHHRLVPCGTPSCLGMSEGWGDFTALMMLNGENDLQRAARDGASFPIGHYAVAGVVRGANYFGMRRAPYSTDPQKYPFTFAHVRRSASLPTGAPLAPGPTDMAEVHNTGEIWAELLFEGYVRLVASGKAAGRSFEDSRRAMTDYIVAAMKAAPPESTFTEQRDALLAVVRATGRIADFDALAQGFAKRGLGLHAVAPDGSSESFNEAVANFERAGERTLIDARAEGSTLTLRVRNVGWAPLPAATVNVRSRDPRIAFAGGVNAVSLPALAPQANATATIALEASVAPGTTVAVDID